MKKRGFTLIELLAVIVILAIIALIATPIVMNVIEKSRKGAAERGADNYIDAVEVAVGTERIDGEALEGTYIIQEDGSICPEAGCEKDDVDKVKIDMSGNKPSSGTIFIDNGLVTTGSIMVIGDYTVSYNNIKKTYVATKGNISTTVYRWSTETISIEDIIDPSIYTTEPTTLGKDYYLKHVVENNVVTESYVCAIYNDNNNDNDNDNDNEICLRGGSKDYHGYAENASDYTGNVLILKGLKDDGFSCSLSKVLSDCRYGSVTLRTTSVGVNAHDGKNQCVIKVDGSSLCGSY